MKQCKTSRCPRRARCKVCNAARARQAAKTLAKYHARREEIVRMLGGKCSEIDCEATDGLEIDHIDPAEKSFYISRCMTCALPKILEEVKKCRLLCVDHHKKTPSYGCSRARWREYVAPADTSESVAPAESECPF